MRIPEEKIDEIRHSADIVDVISTYLPLKRKGKNYQGLCPFHQEKTPSFVVSPEKQIYHCFGCHAGGNVFKFLMEFKSVSFIESVQEIAEVSGIPIKFDDNYDPEKQSEHEQLYDLNVFAAKFFVDSLKTKDAEEAREYLEKRNIKKKTQKQFGIGFAPFGWDNFLKHAEKNKIDLEAAKTLGLIDKKDSGGYYDKYRGRIIFPILSTNGRVIAFGGRILEKNDNVAKYLNSPESIIYHKRKTLYGLYHSKEEIRKQDQAILVEGYMDLISLAQHGVNNVIASSGTALTEEQVKLLSRFSKNIIVLFDADEAGQKASLRSIEILLKNNFEVKVHSLPDNEDPDSFINKMGKKEFLEEIKKSMNFLEYQMESYAKEGMLEDPTRQTEAIRELIKTSTLVNDQLKRNMLLKSIAKKFEISEKLIEDEAIKYVTNRSKKEKRQEIYKERISQREKAEKEVTVKVSTTPLEKDLIKLFFENNEEIIGHIFDNVLPEDFTDPNFSKLAEIILESYKEGVFETSELIEKIEDENLKALALTMSIENYSISKKWDEFESNDKKNSNIDLSSKIASDVVKKFNLCRIDDRIKKNNKIMETLKEESDIIELMKENNELVEQRKAILNQVDIFNEE